MVKLAGFNLWQNGSFPKARLWKVSDQTVALLRHTTHNSGVLAIGAPADNRYWELVRLTKNLTPEMRRQKTSGRIVALLGMPGNSRPADLSKLGVTANFSSRCKRELATLPIIAGGYRINDRGLVPSELFWRLPAEISSPLAISIWQHRDAIQTGGMLAVAPDASGLLCPVLITELVDRNHVTLRTQPFGMVNIIISYLNSRPLLKTWQFMSCLPSELLLQLQRQIALKHMATDQNGGEHHDL